MAGSGGARNASHSSGINHASFNCLRNLGVSVGFSRPSLFLWMLTETLLAARDPERADSFRPAGLRQYIFADILGDKISLGADLRSPLELAFERTSNAGYRFR